jgi:hypothetical protein
LRVDLKPAGGRFPAVIAGVVFIVAWLICWTLVSKDVDEKWAVGMAAKHEFKFAGTFAVLAAGAAYAAATRLARGSPELGREEWSLHAANFGTGLVADVLRGLERHGYDISIIGLSEAGVPAKAVQPTDRLVGTRLGIRDRRHPYPAAGLALLLPPPTVSRQRAGFGMLTVTDQDPREGTYAEMAQYLIAALGELTVDLRFKPLASRLAPDPAAPLRKSLPASPRHVPGAANRSRG